MLSDPPHSINWGRIYGPVYVLVSATDYGTHTWWCVGVSRGARHWCFRFQGSAGILQPSQCKWMISTQGTYTGNTGAPSCWWIINTFVFALLFPLCLFVCLWGAMPSLSSWLHYCNFSQDPDTSLASAVNTWLCPLIEPGTVLLWDTTRLAEQEDLVKCNSLFMSSENNNTSCFVS